MKKILFLSPRFPYPPDKGDKLIVYNRLKGLSKKYRIILVTFSKKKEEKYHREISKYCYKLIKIKYPIFHRIISLIFYHNVRKIPLQVAFFTFGRLKRDLQKLFREENISLLHVFTIRMMENVSFYKERFKLVCEFIDSMGLNFTRREHRESSLLKKLLFRYEAKSISNYERLICDTIRYGIVVSEYDKKFIGKSNIEVIPNGTDFINFSVDFVDKRRNDKGVVVLGFSGNMSYFPNVEAVEWFIENCFNELLVDFPTLKFMVIGNNPSGSLKRYSSDNVIITGWVDDIRKELERLDIVVAPMFSGSGMQNKIVEAMALGKPVITTTIGNIGIKAQNGKEIIIADDRKTFIKACNFLILNSKKRLEIGSNARKLVSRKFTWEISNKRILDIYYEIIEDK